MNGMMPAKFLGVVMCTALMLQRTVAHASVVYGFNHIADVTLNYPSINDSGVVAFEGRLSSSNLATGVYTGTGGALTTIATAALDSVQECTINNAGQVAFVGAIPGTNAFGIYRGSGGPLTTISGPNLAVYGPMPAVSGDGSATFFGSFTSGGSGIFSGNGGTLTPLFLATPSSGASYGGAFNYAAASKRGPIAYEKFISVTNPQIITNQSGNEALVASASGPAAGYESISVNDSGTVAIVGSFSFTDSGLYVGNGSGLVKVVPTVGSGPFTTIFTAAINDSGTVAFQGTTSSGHRGIYTGPDPALDKVIQLGDSLDGSTVTDIALGTEGLNNQGQIAFWAALADGRQAVFAASAVPEPATGAVLMLFACGVVAQRRRYPSAR